MYLPKEIIICDVGLRDGLQNEKSILKTAEKIELLNMMVDAGFKYIEVGSFMSTRAVPQMADTDDIFRSIKQLNNVEYRALIANLKGIERAVACGCKKVKLNVSASKAHNLANLNKTPEESVDGFKSCVDEALKNCLDISGSISMAFGSPWDSEIPVHHVKDIVQAYLNVGITEISLSDASGMANPSQVHDMCVEMKKTFPDVKWWLHFHNTRGLGIANIVAGLQSGITRFDASLAGVGGCPFVPGAAGNVATEDLVHMCDEMKITTGINLDMLLKISRKISQLVGHSTDSYILSAGKSKELIRELPKGQIKNQVFSKN